MAGTVDLADRLAGGVWGHLAGDAVGVPYEGRQPAQIGEVRFGIVGRHGQPPGTWSDDGAMMLALLDSLLSVGFDTQDQGRRFVDWYRRGAYAPGRRVFDIGNTTSAALRRIEDGTPAEEAGGTREQDNGNGSLMRILPLALVERDISDEQLVEHAHRASAVTHGHPLSLACCALYVLAARRLLEGERDRAAAIAHARVTLRTLYGHRPDRDLFVAALDFVEAWAERQGRGRVWDSFWSAGDAFAGAHSSRETVERAIHYGNDTDTTACIAGGLAGIYWGVDGIPREWLQGMRGKEIVRPLVDRLTAAAVDSPAAARGPTEPVPLGKRFDQALAYASDLHRTQPRKATTIPYMSHLLGVASLVLEDGGEEDEAIAALLHDAVEDQGGEPTLQEIRRRFGDHVASIVEGCSDTDQVPKPPWRNRKEAYLRRLRDAPESVIRVSLADKLHNARSTARDLRVEGPAVWDRFNEKRAGEQLWYYRSLLEIFRARSRSPMVDELERVIEEIDSAAR